MVNWLLCRCLAITIFAPMILQAGNTMTFLQRIKEFDYQLFSKINGEWHNAFFDAFFPFTRDTNFWIPFYLFLILFTTINFKKYGWLWVIFLIINVMLSDYVSSTLIKETFFRLRPCRDPAIADSVRFLVQNCPGSSSFTSSHAANHFAAAMFIFTTFKNIIGKWKWLLFLWAFLPSYAQVYVGVHFFTDIAGGAIVGLLLGYFVGNIFNNRVGLVHDEVKKNL